MRRANVRTGRRIHDHVRDMLHRERPRHFRKTQIVTNAEADSEIAGRAGGPSRTGGLRRGVDLRCNEIFSPRKTNAFVERGGGAEMGLWVFSGGVPPSVPQKPGVEKENTLAVRNVA